MKRFNTLGLQIAALLASAPALALRNDLTGDARELMAAITAKTDEVKNLALDAQKGNGELSAAFKAKADRSSGDACPAHRAAAAHRRATAGESGCRADAGRALHQ
jgi:hypothetical protein